MEILKVAIKGVAYEIRLIIKGKDLVYYKKSKNFGYYKIREAGLATGPIDNEDTLAILTPVKKTKKRK